MASRPVWKGYLKLSLVSVPISAFTAQESDSGTIHLNQLHEECHSRIKYQKTCPIHGEVPNTEIVSGYQVAKDQYVTIDPDELKAIRGKSDQSLEIDTFIHANQLDDRFLSERVYYLVPDGAVAQKPYALIRHTLENEKLQAIAEVILNGREQLVLIRSFGQLLLMTVLQHSSDIKDVAIFEADIKSPELAAQEVRLTIQLVQGMTKKKFDFEAYKDHYRKRLSELIEAKIGGKKLVSPPDEDVPAVINLMDALKASIQNIPGTKTVVATGNSSTTTKKKPARIEAKSSPRKSSPAQKDKSAVSKPKRGRNTG